MADKNRVGYPGIVSGRDLATNATIEIGADTDAQTLFVEGFVWDTTTLAPVKATQPRDANGNPIVTLYDAAGNAVDVVGLTADQQNDYHVSDFDIALDPMYVGQVKKTGVWKITEINIANGTARYLSGSSGYTTAWTNRATGSYDYFDTEF